MLALVKAFVRETRPGRALRVTLDSVLERDPGFDSLGRAELLLRTERAFGVAMPERALTEGETPRDLLRLVLGAHAPAAEAAKTVQILAVRADQCVPSDAHTLLEAVDWHLACHPDQLQIHLFGEKTTLPKTSATPNLSPAQRRWRPNSPDVDSHRRRRWPSCCRLAASIFLAFSAF